jgi:hypothetical protein
MQVATITRDGPELRGLTGQVGRPPDVRAAVREGVRRWLEGEHYVAWMDCTATRKVRTTWPGWTAPLARRSSPWTGGVDPPGRMEFTPGQLIHA